MKQKLDFYLVVGAMVALLVMAGLSGLKAQTPAPEKARVRVMLNVGSDIIILECDSSDKKSCDNAPSVKSMWFIGAWDKTRIIVSDKCVLNCK